MNETTFPEQFPRLETTRLVLRALTLDDREAVFGNFSDKDVVQHLMEPFTSVEQAASIIKEFLQLFEQKKGLFWAVTLKQDGSFIGTCSFEQVEVGGLGEVGFDLARACWGQGLMSEALGAVMRYGFGQLGLKEIEAFTSVHNARAVNLLKRLGFRVDGVKDESYRFVKYNADHKSDRNSRIYRIDADHSRTKIY